jgi:hypothetical protein
MRSSVDSVERKGEQYTKKLKQALVGHSIDDFIKQFDPNFPNHLKIYVDGIEYKIIEGAREKLKDNRL